MLSVQLLPAGYGDCLFVQWTFDNKPYTILLDGGTEDSYLEGLSKGIKKLQNENQEIDLLILSHIDNDHIEGLLELVAAMKQGTIPQHFVKKWWFNSRIGIAKFFDKDEETEGFLLPTNNPDDTQSGFKNGGKLEDFLEECRGWNYELIHHALPVCEGEEFGNAQLRLLSPSLEILKDLGENWEEYFKKENNTNTANKRVDDKESVKELAKARKYYDASKVNGSSIAFLLEVNAYTVLLLADARPRTYIPALKYIYEQRGEQKIAVDLVKLAHHGSKYNYSSDLFKYINCNHFAISTDGSKNGHPHKTTLAKIILREGRDFEQRIHFYFNYREPVLENIFEKELEEGIIDEYNFECHFPEEAEETLGYKINLPHDKS